MKTIRRNGLYILSAYAIAVLVLAIAFWEQIGLVQRIAAIATVLLTVHEWEEIRFPGGFLEMVGGNLGIDLASVDGDALHFKPIVMVFVGTATAFFIPQLPLFACGLLVMGILEGVIHVAGIKLAHAPHPYTPGMATALVYMAFSIASIVLFVQNGAATPLDWALGTLWLFAILAVMELSIWKAAGLNPKDVVARLKGARG